MNGRAFHCGAMSFMLMILLERIGRRREARGARRAALLSPDHPFP